MEENPRTTLLLPKLGLTTHTLGVFLHTALFLCFFVFLKRKFRYKNVG